MWSIEPPPGVPPWIATSAYLAAVIGFLFAQEAGLRLRREEVRAWWAGSGRDLINAAGFLAVAGALRLLGLRWPAALLVGGTLTLLLFGASVFVATQTTARHPRAWSFAAGIALALPVLLAPEAMLGALGRVAARLFGR